MNYQQNRCNSGTNGYGSQSMSALLPDFIDAIKLYKAVGILEHQRRQFERDSAMLALVLPVFPFISFVAHSVYTYYIARRSAIRVESGVVIISARHFKLWRKN
jgi:hypothetical protein